MERGIKQMDAAIKIHKISFFALVPHLVEWCCWRGRSYFPTVWTKHRNVHNMKINQVSLIIIIILPKAAPHWRVNQWSSYWSHYLASNHVFSKQQWCWRSEISQKEPAACVPEGMCFPMATEYFIIRTELSFKGKSENTLNAFLTMKNSNWEIKPN